MEKIEVVITGTGILSEDLTLGGIYTTNITSIGSGDIFADLTYIEPTIINTTSIIGRGYMNITVENLIGCSLFSKPIQFIQKNSRVVKNTIKWTKFIRVRPL